MNEKTPAIPLNIPGALTAMAELTALLNRLQKQEKDKVSIAEPQTPTAKFGSAAADSSRALEQLMQAIDELIQHARLNQQLLNLLAAIRADAKRFIGSIANTTLDITGTVHEFNAAATEIVPSADNTEHPQ